MRGQERNEEDGGKESTEREQTEEEGIKKKGKHRKRTLKARHDVMGRTEAAPRAPLRQRSLLWAALSSRATWEEEELNPELPCSVDTVAL